MCRFHSRYAFHTQHNFESCRSCTNHGLFFVTPLPRPPTTPACFFSRSPRFGRLTLKPFIPDRPCQCSGVAPLLPSGVRRPEDATPPHLYPHQRAGMLSPTGRAKTLDAAADGYVRGEAAGVLVLKEGDVIGEGGIALLSAAVNQDGRAGTLMAPSGPAQQRLLRLSLSNANARASDLVATQVRYLYPNHEGLDTVTSGVLLPAMQVAHCST